MKYFIVATILSLSLQSFAFVPYCANIGTRSEGWKMADGSLKYDQCQDKVAYCGSVGSRSEGWYAAEVESGKLLGWDQCSEDNLKKPVCENIGTRSEGWKLPNGKTLWDQCSEKVVFCGAVGTRSEGWYAAKLVENTSKLLDWDNCSKN